MKIILIHQAGTSMKWESHYNAESFERAVAQELHSNAAPVSSRKSAADSYRIYTDTSPASVQTAALLFSSTTPPEQSSLLDDVALRAFQDGQGSRPLWLWRVMGETQWFLGESRQAETRQATLQRAQRFIEQLEAEDKDSIVICRGLMLSALKAVLKRRGYLLEGGNLRPKPLDRIRATKKFLHCGGCHHNCLLTDPKCQIGISKAQERHLI